MRFEIITIFPGFFAGFFEHGIVRRAQAQGLVEIAVRDLREFTHDRHRTVDDRPFGGGEGMVLKPEPLAEALASLGLGPKTHLTEIPSAAQKEGIGEAQGLALPGGGSTEPQILPSLRVASGPPDDNSRGRGGSRVVLLSAQGRPFTQAVARELAKVDRVVLVCGRYEGVDERINALYCDLELSIGDYVLSGGELAAAVVVDATMRLVPGVLGNEASGEFESFGVADTAITADQEGVPRSQHGAGGLLDYPHYTRPAEFGGMRVPEVLMNGDHLQIRRWRREQQLRKTLQNRPDLLERAREAGVLSEDDRKTVARLRDEMETE